MKFKYIIVPILLLVLVFGNVSQVFAQVGAVDKGNQASILEKIKDILVSLQGIFSTTLAEMTGSYATAGASTVERVVTADFGKVAYYPNLKSKIGLASNIASGAALEAAVPLLDPIGPGAICNNIEFMTWLKHQSGTMKNTNDTPSFVPVADMDNPALVEILSSSTDPRSRPVRTLDTPAPWLRQYEQKIGDRDISLLMQLTGPAPQFQEPSSTYSDLGRAPVPTDIVASANYTARFTAASNHAYPILWSLWNEPGHTLMSVSRGRNADGTAIDGCAFDKKGNLASTSCELLNDFQLRRQKQHDLSAVIFANMYKKYDAAMRPVIGEQSRFGGASFLAADFATVSSRLSSENGAVYLKEVLLQSDALPGPHAVSNFFTFNSFGVKFADIMKDARTVLATQPEDSLGERAPFIFTQYAPGSMKVNDDGELVTASTRTPIMRAVTDELTDMVTFQESADLQFACHAYWVGGVSSVFIQDANKPTKLTTSARFSALKMFAELPIMRVPLAVDNIRVANSDVMGLAGINPTTAAVLLWNNSTTITTSVPLQEINMPASIAKGVTTLQILTEDGLTSRTITSTSSDIKITLPPNSVALLKTQIPGVDPLSRRKSLGAVSTGVKFLKTRTFTDRIITSCAADDVIPGVNGCAVNTGTYGFYDSVRSVAYLGMGTTTGARDPEVRAVYQNIPKQVYVNLNVYNSNDVSWASYGKGLVTIKLKFPSCLNQEVTISTNTNELLRRGGGVLDLEKENIRPGCYVGKPTEIIFTTTGLTPGTQAEIYLSGSSTESENMRAQTNQMRNTIGTTSAPQP